MKKHDLLLNLADYTNLLHLALEGDDVPTNDRMIYLGHLAMCARIFKTIYLEEAVNELDIYLSIENGAYLIGTPNNERGVLTKEAWNTFSPMLKKYIETK